MNNVYKMIQNNEAHSLAIVDAHTSISYEELFSFCVGVKENFYHLQKGDCVIIYAKKSVEYVSVMVAMLNIGVVYLPLDEHTPVEKVKEYSRLLNAKQVFVDCYHDIEMETLISEMKTKRDTVEASLICHEEAVESDLAYMICTSGSSGEPKMVMIEHHSLLNLISSLHEIIYKEIETSRQLHIAVVAPFSFDASIKQIFCALCYGHVLYICSDIDKMLGRRFVTFLLNNQIDVIDCTPTLISSIYADKKREKIHCLKAVICGGEKLLRRHVNEVIDIFGSDIQMINVYGPTECCVDATYYKVPIKSLDIETKENIPIGRALNHVVLELDENKELIIGGACVGRGYYGKEDQGGYFTNEEGKKCYRTGDICYEENGLFYLEGRADNQEKINGFRIEPSIVDFELAKIQSVDYSVTVAAEFMGKKFLCTFIHATLERKDILMYLKEHLPDYCVPKFFFYTKEKLILNKNGKTDIKYYKTIGDNYLKKKFRSERETGLW